MPPQGIAEKTFKKLLSLGSKYISRETVPYRQYKPDAPEEEYMCKKWVAIVFTVCPVLVSLSVL